jgi:hypothetical protein
MARRSQRCLCERVGSLFVVALLHVTHLACGVMRIKQRERCEHLIPAWMSHELAQGQQRDAGDLCPTDTLHFSNVYGYDLVNRSSWCFHLLDQASSTEDVVSCSPTA